MSTDERVTIQLHGGGEHVGQITRRTRNGLVLDTGDEIPVARMCAISTRRRARLAWRGGRGAAVSG